MKQFFKEVWQTFLPSTWPELSKRPLGKSIGYFSKVLVLAFVIMFLLAIPSLIKLPGVISEQLGKFEALQLDGNFTMTSPIKMPKSESIIIFDTSGAYTELTTQRVLITEKTIFYRPFFKTYELDTSELKDLKQNRNQVKNFLSVLVFFLLPSIVFYTYLAIWLKYFLIITLLSLVLFLLLDLTHWRRRWKELFVIACYVSLIPVIAEVVVSSINANLLIPVFNLFGLITLYLVPIVILAILAIGAAVSIYYEKK